jgi:hypothetical protein
LFFGPVHKGPGVKRPPVIVDRIDVYVDGVLLSEAKR